MIDAATRRHERHAGLLFGAILTLFTLVPLASLAAHDSLAIHAVAPVFCWTFNLWLFGWARMRSAASFMMTGTATPVPDTQGAQAFLTGRALARGLIGPEAPTVPVRISTTSGPSGAPCLSAAFVGAQGELTPLDTAENLALAQILGQGAHAYTLRYLRHDLLHTTLDIGEMTRHQQLALMHAANTALDRAKNSAHPHAPSLMERLFPGKLPS